jgi:hypothetical protein
LRSGCGERRTYPRRLERWRETHLSPTAHPVTALCTDALQILDSHGRGFGRGLPVCSGFPTSQRCRSELQRLPRISAHADPGARGEGEGSLVHLHSLANFFDSKECFGCPKSGVVGEFSTIPLDSKRAADRRLNERIALESPAEIRAAWIA